MDTNTVVARLDTNTGSSKAPVSVECEIPAVAGRGRKTDPVLDAFAAECEAAPGKGRELIGKTFKNGNVASQMNKRHPTVQFFARTRDGVSVLYGRGKTAAEIEAERGEPAH
jgi:hypothetical protein